MAKTRTVTVKGTASWAKVFEQNRDLKGWCGPTGTAKGTFEDCDGAYTIDIVMDTDEFTTLKSSGSMKTGTPVEDGLKVKFIRKHQGPFKEASGAPLVTHKDGSPWDIDEDGTIGNDSIVEVTCSVYDIKAYGTTGTRLDKVRVIEHVKYVAPADPEGVDEAVVDKARAILKEAEVTV